MSNRNNHTTTRSVIISTEC